MECDEAGEGQPVGWSLGHTVCSRDMSWKSAECDSACCTARTSDTGCPRRSNGGALAGIRVCDAAPIATSLNCAIASHRDTHSQINRHAKIQTTNQNRTVANEHQARRMVETADTD